VAVCWKGHLYFVHRCGSGFASMLLSAPLVWRTGRDQQSNWSRKVLDLLAWCCHSRFRWSGQCDRQRTGTL